MRPQIGVGSLELSLAARCPQPDRIALFGLVAAFSHALGNPMTAIAAGASSLRPGTPGSPVPVVASLVSSAQSACQTVRQATRLVKSSVEANPVDVNALIRDAATKARTGRGNEIAWLLNLCFDATAVGDAETIGRIIDEIIANAIEATLESRSGDTAAIEITTEVQDDALHVTVADKGLGVEDHGQIFDLFFTTKPGRSGQGLSVARGLAIANGGMLRASANNGRGTRLILTLPRAL
jgi:signal transduction histidine kinase